MKHARVCVAKTVPRGKKRGILEKLDMPLNRAIVRRSGEKVGRGSLKLFERNWGCSSAI